MDKRIFLLDKEKYTKEEAESLSQEILEGIVSLESYDDDSTVMKVDANGYNSVEEALKEEGLEYAKAYNFEYEHKPDEFFHIIAFGF